VRLPFTLTRDWTLALSSLDCSLARAAGLAHRLAPPCTALHRLAPGSLACGPRRLAFYRGLPPRPPTAWCAGCWASTHTQAHGLPGLLPGAAAPDPRRLVCWLLGEHAHAGTRAARLATGGCRPGPPPPGVLVAGRARWLATGEPRLGCMCAARTRTMQTAALLASWPIITLQPYAA
jgi:hypothetical protein